MSKSKILYAISQDFGLLKELKGDYVLSFEGKEKQIFDFIVSEHRKGASFLSEEMKKKLVITEEVFQGIEEKDAVKNFAYYVKEEQGKVAKNVISDYISSIQHTLKQEKDSEFLHAQNIVENMKEYGRKLATIGMKQTGKTMFELNEMFTELKEVQNIKTGITKLDKLIGGFPRGAISIISGLSNHGKTTFANQCIVDAVVKQKLKVCMINLEIPEEKVYSRLMGIVSKEGFRSHQHNFYDPQNPDDVKKHTQRAIDDKKLIGEYINERLVIKAGTFTSEELKKDVEALVKEDYDIIFCDYFQLVDVNADSNNKVQALTQLQEDIRNIIVGTKTSFVWLAQLKENNKKGKDGELEDGAMEFDIAWCKDLYKGADLELRIWRDYEDVKTRMFTPFMNIGIKKARENEKEIFNFGFNGNIGTIGEYAIDESNKDSFEERYSFVKEKIHEKPSAENYTDPFDNCELW